MVLEVQETFSMLGFTSFLSVVGFLSDIAILVLAIYTLYITAFCKKVELITCSKHSSIFYGDSISMTIMNRALHPIPIKGVFIMKRIDGIFYRLEVAMYDDPISIQSWSMLQVPMQPFTEIYIDEKYKSQIEYFELWEDSIIVICAGRYSIWVKPFDISPLKEAKKALDNHEYKHITVVRRMYDNIVLSESVDCCIKLRLKDMNGYKRLTVLYGITGFDNGMSIRLSEDLFGYNAIPFVEKTPESISKTIQDLFNISDKDITVELIN